MDSPDQYPIVAIYLKGKGLLPEYISEVLGIDPTSSHTKGSIVSKSKLAIPAKTGIWVLKTSTSFDSSTAQIEDLLNRVATVGKTLNNLEGVDEAYLDVFYPVDPNKLDSIEFNLTRNILTKLFNLGLELKVSSY